MPFRPTLTVWTLLVAGVAGLPVFAQTPPAAPPKVAPRAAAAPAKPEPWLADALALVPARDAAAPAAPALKAGDSLVCIGDSITAGGGYLRDMDQVFAQQYPDLKIAKAINKGIGGQKAENLVIRFEKDVVALKPAVVTINVGINDVWHRLSKPHDEGVLATYTSNVTRMVEMAQAAGIRVILVAPTVIQEDPASEGNKRLPLYVAAMKGIAAEKQCGFVDLHAMFLAALAKKPADVKGNWLTRDGVHMKPLGDAIMAVGILRAMGVPEAKLAATLIPAPAPRLAPAKAPRGAAPRPAAGT